MIIFVIIICTDKGDQDSFSLETILKSSKIKGIQGKKHELWTIIYGRNIVRFRNNYTPFIFARYLGYV